MYGKLQQPPLPIAAVQPSPKKSKKGSSSNVLIALLAVVAVGLFLNCYLTYNLTHEIVHTRQTALGLIDDSVLGRALVYNDYGSIARELKATVLNGSIPQLIRRDLYYNFQKTASLVQNLAQKAAVTAASRGSLFSGIVNEVFYYIATYSSMVESIAAAVQKVPPMVAQQDASGIQSTDCDGAEQEGAQKDMAVDPVEGEKDLDASIPPPSLAAAGDFNALQTLTDVITELPPWIDNQLNVTDWKLLGASCDRFLNNFLTQNWATPHEFKAYAPPYGMNYETYWWIPPVVIDSILIPIQQTCAVMATWNVKSIQEVESGGSSDDGSNEGQQQDGYQGEDDSEMKPHEGADDSGMVAVAPVPAAAVSSAENAVDDSAMVPN